ncbi:MAG: hypothetical protein JNL89_20890 [Rhodanobacteraceae bacterium]|nr:hypothetical protein [Rhodanobacteraceae bacterium]
MNIQVIDPLESRRQRLRAIFVVRALRVLERLAPGILNLVARFRDVPQEAGTVGHECNIEVALADGTRFRAEARNSRLIKALDAALKRVLRRIEAARERRLAREGMSALPAPGKA